MYIFSDSKVNLPKSTLISKGSVISSTILNTELLDIILGKGFKVFNNISCFSGPLFNKILIEGINTSLPKLRENSLK